ncbi:MAG: hypothetical protein KDA89_04355, partial [Planctomycetaceae bacterium]|nr:hypothetical protein [Planctomycetaceae bacterium]
RDWSEVAALAVVDTSDPVGLFEHVERTRAVRAGNARMLLSSGREAARWGDKSGEIRSAFAPHQLRLADAVGRGEDYAEFARRFSAVVQQLEILTAMPDTPWAYRKSLRMEMQRHPRPAVEKVRNGSIVQEAHPADEYRKSYFESLGNVLQQVAEGSVDPLLLRQLAGFTMRYEPLLSHFAHYELVRIHELTGHQSPAMELRHRLHTVFYSQPGDLSVDVVADALQQILEDPELLPDDVTRFDYANALVQQLVDRWNHRRGYEPRSARRAQHVVDHCVSVTNSALDAMSGWAEAAGMTNADMLARRRFVTKTLVSPLRQYREQVLAHRIRTEPPTAEDTADFGNLPLLLDPSELPTN